MKSKVHFLPWPKIGEYRNWIEKINPAAHVKERDLVAVKIHFGEDGNSGFIDKKYVLPVAEALKGKGAKPFLTDANTIYVGKRSNAVEHHIVAEKHGFALHKCGCPVIIADGLRGNSGVDVEINQKHFKTVSIANAVHYSDSLVMMSHFKGHEISGFGGTLKNAGMGCGTRAGKYSMHDSVHPAVNNSTCIACGQCVKWCPAGALELSGPKITYLAEKCIGCGECILSCPSNVFRIPWNEAVGSVQEKIVEFALGVFKGKKHFSINFINHITKFCDCYPDKGVPLMEDIGVAASADPVALDQACADIVNKKFGGDFFRHIFPDINWEVQLDYAEKLGLGTRQYEIEEY